MRLGLIAIGRLKSGPERELVARYWQRLELASRTAGLTGTDLREFDESRSRSAEERKQQEAAILLAAVPAGARLIALDERGKTIGSEAFAADIGKARDAGVPSFVLAIGGPDGLSEQVRLAAAQTLSFGAMTWPHQLVRVMAAEQLYRAVTILTGHPYHRV